MYAIKRERTGMILTTNFDHEVNTMSTFKTKKEANVELISRRKAQADHYGSTATFTSGKDEFTVKVDDINYHVTERFYIEKV